MKCVAVALVLGTVATAHAERTPEYQDRPLRFGPRLGIDVAWLTGEDVREDQFEERICAHAGGFVLIAFSPYVAFEGGVFYAQKGHAFSNGSIKLDYVQTALLAVGRVPLGLNVKLRGLLGPTTSYNVRARAIIDDDNMNVRNEIAPFDVGLTGGIGVESMTDYGVILFDARFEYGLLRLDGTKEHEDIKSRVATVSVGFGF